MAAAAEAPPLLFEIQYPEELRSAKARKLYKHKVLKDNPDTLTADTALSGDKSITTNLLFHTEHTIAWHISLCSHFKHIRKRGICNGRQIIIFEDEEKDPDNTKLTINLYHNGTVLIQGSEAGLSCFEKQFKALKELATTHSVEQECLTHSDQLQKSTAPISTDEGDDIIFEEDELPPLVLQLQSTVALMRESLSLQEVELVELKEQQLSHLTASQDIQHIKAQLSQRTAEHQASLQELRSQVKELQQDRDAVRRELSALREELQLRDCTVLSLREQLLSLNTQDRLSSAQTSTGPKPATAPCPSTAQTPAGPTTATAPGQTVEPNQPGTSAPSTQADTSPNTTGESKNRAHRKGTKKENTEVLILIDSNGKFVDEEQLFPGRTVTKVWCPTTKSALEILAEPDFGAPRQVIIHTGTNDLRAQQEQVAGSVRRVAEKAAQTFPRSKIIISTLLPRRDFHPMTIQRVNAEISRGCALIPNVYLAHHPALGPNSLYDHVHLHKQAVSIFSDTLREAALGRHRTRPPHHPAHPTPAAAWRPPHHPAHPTPAAAWRPPHHPAHPTPAAAWRPPHQPAHPTPAAAWRAHTHTGHQPKPGTPRHSWTRQHSQPPRSTYTHPSQPSPQPAPSPQGAALQQPQPSYADVLRRPGQSTGELGEIRELLSLICSRLMS